MKVVKTETWDYNPFTGEYDNTESWACPRQRTTHWGCRSILERLIKSFDRPDICFGKTDGIPEDIITVDIDPSVKPSVIADWDHLPFKDCSFDFSFWDPPYDKRYERGREEIFRVSKRVAILHQIVYPNPPDNGWVKEAVIGITTGPNMRIRALQIYKRKALPLTQFQEG